MKQLSTEVVHKPISENESSTADRHHTYSPVAATSKWYWSIWSFHFGHKQIEAWELGFYHYHKSQRSHESPATLQGKLILSGWIKSQLSKTLTFTLSHYLKYMLLNLKSAETSNELAFQIFIDRDDIDVES